VVSQGSGWGDETYTKDDDEQEVDIGNVVELEPQILGHKAEGRVFGGSYLVACVLCRGVAVGVALRLWQRHVDVDSATRVGLVGGCVGAVERGLPSLLGDRFAFLAAGADAPVQALLERVTLVFGLGAGCAVGGPWAADRVSAGAMLGGAVSADLHRMRRWGCDTSGTSGSPGGASDMAAVLGDVERGEEGAQVAGRRRQRPEPGGGRYAGEQTNSAAEVVAATVHDAVDEGAEWWARARARGHEGGEMTDGCWAGRDAGHGARNDSARVGGRGGGPGSTAAQRRTRKERMCVGVGVRWWEQHAGVCSRPFGA